MQHGANRGAGDPVSRAGWWGEAADGQTRGGCLDGLVTTVSFFVHRSPGNAAFRVRIMWERAWLGMPTDSPSLPTPPLTTRDDGATAEPKSASLNFILWEHSQL